jgi:hypothetical protein
MSKSKHPGLAPLVEGDTETQTVGCRHSNPNVCRNNGLAGRCAFVRDDNICLEPPRSWKKLYAELSGANEEPSTEEAAP